MDYSWKTILRRITLTALLGPALNAAPLTLSNTGVDLNNDSIDDNYTITRLPDGSTGLFPTYLNFAVIHPGPADSWSANSASSIWIGPAVQVDDTLLPPGMYYYSTWFSLSGSSIPSLKLLGNWSADGRGDDILVNGRSTGFHTPRDAYTVFYPFEIDQNSCAGGCFQDGVNELTFLVRNGGVETSLRVEAALDFVPEPATNALIGGGLALLVLLRRRAGQRSA